jgi:hypothetical protein
LGTIVVLKICKWALFFVVCLQKYNFCFQIVVKRPRKVCLAPQRVRKLDHAEVPAFAEAATPYGQSHSSASLAGLEDVNVRLN